MQLVSVRKVFILLSYLYKLLGPFSVPLYTKVSIKQTHNIYNKTHQHSTNELIITKAKCFY